MTGFPPHDPVAEALNARFGPEFGAAFNGDGAFSLDPLRLTLKALGDPHLNLPPVIHIAGTNGKGSTAAMCASILAAAGLCAHAFTQPHLIATTERIALYGQSIAAEALLALIERVAAAAAPGLSHFEAQTACAFLAFAETPADFVVLEAGVGGRDDATNVIERPAVSVITRIGYDHQALLGQTLPLIARAKAGIIKPGAPVITAPQEDPAVDRVFEAAAMRARSPLLMGGVDWRIDRAEESFFLETDTESYYLPNPSWMPGAHQIENAALAALACLTATPEAVSFDHVTKGLAHAKLPARLQRVRSGRLAHTAEHERAMLFVDGGHNPMAAAALADWALDHQPTPWAAIVGMLADKDAHAFLKGLGPSLDALVLVEPKGQRRAMPTANLRRAAKAAGLAAQSALTLQQAVPMAAAALGRPGHIVITGSLSLAAEAVFSETTS